VRVADEMLSMMSVLRHFETTARVIKGYDEMLGTAISTIAEF
jgi:flagellar basal body rod protein FlgG